MIVIDSKWCSKVSEKRLEPYKLCGRVGKEAMLGIGGALCNNSLFLDTLSDGHRPK